MIDLNHYELYCNGKLIEEYTKPVDVRSSRAEPVPARAQYTECGNCGRKLLAGDGCGLC
jgi:hypothetical protein